MSHNIDERIGETQERLFALKAVRERFPDAYLEGDRWYSESLKLEMCDGIEPAIEGESIEVRLYTVVIGIRVYPADYRTRSMEFCLEYIEKQTHNPTIYPQLLAMFRHLISGTYRY